MGGIGTQSTTDGANSADLTVDGSYATSAGACAKTTSESVPWIEVRLNSVTVVSRVQITSSDDATGTTRQIHLLYLTCLIKCISLLVHIINKPTDHNIIIYYSRLYIHV